MASRRRELQDILSNSSSRSVLRARTPQVDGEENGALDVNHQSIEELLAKKLELLQLFLEASQQNALVAQLELLHEGAREARQAQAGELNRLRIQSHLTTINEIIGLLQEPRTQVSSQLRELLLAQLFKLIVAKPIAIQNEERPDEYVGEESATMLLKTFTLGNYRSESEFSLLYRATVALLASDIEEFGVLALSEFLTLVAKLIQEPPTSAVTNENKAGIITGLSGLLMVLHNDSSSYGIDDKIKWLLEIAEGYEASSSQLTADIVAGHRDHLTFITDAHLDQKMVNEQQLNANAEASVAIAALHGMAALLTLLPSGDYRNELITDMMDKLVPLLDNDSNMDIAKAAGRAIALCYELFKYDSGDGDSDGAVEDDDEEYNYNSPYYEQGHLLSILKRISNVSLHKVGKKDKKVATSILRDVTNTIENYTNVNTRTEIYKRLSTGQEIINEQMDGTVVKLLKLKTLPINSWFLYIRLIHIKWLFLFGVHSQLVGNSSIRSVLKEPRSAYLAKYKDATDVGFDLINEDFGLYVHQVDDKTRSKKLKKAREVKIDSKLDLLTLDD